MKPGMFNMRLSLSRWMERTRQWFRQTQTAMGAAARDEAGVVILALVFVIGSAALVTTTMILLQNSGVQADLKDLKSQNDSIGKVNDALFVYIIQNDAVPCPADGTAGDGASIADCDDTGGTANAGIVPWSTLGLSPEDATDAHGNYYTYVAAQTLSDGGTDSLCQEVSGEFSGEVNAGDVEIDTSGDDTAEITTAIYAVIGHGKNRSGGYTTRDTFTGTPPSTLEDNNSAGSGGSGFTGTSGTQPLHDVTNNEDGLEDAIFDDVVTYKQTSDFTSFCEDLVANGDVNNFLEVDFEGPNDITDNFTVTGTATRTTPGGDGVAELTGDTTLDTQDQFPVDIAPTYISVEWTPIANVAGTEGGLSIVTRSGGGSPDTTPDLFTNGVTFRFWQDTGSNNIGAAAEPVANTILILCDADCGSTTQVGTVDLEINTAYLIEAYDDGEKVWGRITEVGDMTNRAVDYDTSESVTEDVNTLPNLVSFINIQDGSNSLVSQIDDVLVARAMGGIALDGTGDYIQLGGGSNRDEFNQTGSMTLELWVRPTAALGSFDTFISKYTFDGTPTTDQSYLLAMDSGGSAIELTLVDSSATEESCVSTISPAVDEWTHIAAVYDNGVPSVTFYENGEQSGGCTSSITITDINDTGLMADSHVGAGELDAGGPTHEFTGDVAELRIWDVARTAAEILANYRSRLAGDLSLDNLELIWMMDVDDVSGGTQGFEGADAPCSADIDFGGGQNCNAQDAGNLLGNAQYIGAQEEFRLPFADQVCADNEDGLFSCLYDVPNLISTFGYFTSTIPANLLNVSVTMWGGGGASSEDFTDPSSRNSGGGGGFGAGRVPSINGTAIPGEVLFVTVGAGGAAQSGDNGGSGAGGTSLRLTDETGDISMLAGGGGGAGTGSTANFDGNVVDTDDCNEYATIFCGGGGAGLAGNTAIDSDFVDADACGGAGGGAGTGSPGTGGFDTACTTATQRSGVGQDGGGGTGSAQGGTGDGFGGLNTGEAGAGGGGASGGG